MAFLTAKQISRLAIQLLSRRLVLARTVSMVPGEEFRGSNGDTVTVRVPVARDSKIQAVPGSLIDSDDIQEESTDVTVVQVYDATSITDHQLTLQIANYGRQVMLPLVDSVARGCEDQLAGAMNDLPADDSFAETATDADTKGKLLDAWEALTEADVPPDGRFLAVSARSARRIMEHPEFTRVDASGSSDALRRAVLGNLYGFEVVQSNGLSRGRASAYHRSSFGFATFPPVEVEGGDGGVQSAVVTEQNISLRTLRQWNASRLQREQVVTAFAGANTIDTDRVYTLDTVGVS